MLTSAKILPILQRNYISRAISMSKFRSLAHSYHCITNRSVFTQKVEMMSKVEIAVDRAKIAHGNSALRY